MTAAPRPQEAVSRVATPAPSVPVTEPLNEYYGTVGARETLTLSVVHAIPTPTRYGGFLTILADADGHRFKWFANDLYDDGDVLAGTWAVKSHEEFRGQRETMLNRPTGVHALDAPSPAC